MSPDALDARPLPKRAGTPWPENRRGRSVCYLTVNFAIIPDSLWPGIVQTIM
jgi:hypothetical protein